MDNVLPLFTAEVNKMEKKVIEISTMKLRIITFVTFRLKCDCSRYRNYLEHTVEEGKLTDLLL